MVVCGEALVREAFAPLPAVDTGVLVAVFATGLAVFLVAVATGLAVFLVAGWPEPQKPTWKPTWRLAWKPAWQQAWKPV